MSESYKLLFFLFAGLIAGVVSAQPAGGSNQAEAQIELTAEQERRFQALAHELRCLVCQNQNIAESNAELASDLRIQTRTMLRDGATDTEIRDYMTARYGDFVLYRPPVKPSTYVLWFGPGLILFIAMFVAWRTIKGSQSSDDESSEQDAP